MLALSAPVERTANGASEPANGTSSRRNGNGASVNDRAQQPSSHQSSKVIMSQRVPTGPLLRNAAQQAANVLQERRKGVLLGGSDTPADSGFDWANSSYDRKSRGIRIWLYAIDLRVSLALLDQKWSYLLGVHSITANAEPTHRFHYTYAMKDSCRHTSQLFVCMDRRVLPCIALCTWSNLHRHIWYKATAAPGLRRVLRQATRQSGCGS